MKIEAKTLLGPLLKLEEELRYIIDWYGIDLTPADLRSTLAEFCERYGIDLELLLQDVAAAAAEPR